MKRASNSTGIVAAAAGLLGLFLLSGVAQAAMAVPPDSLPGDSSLAGAMSISAFSPVTTTSALRSVTLYDGTTLFSGVNFTQFEVNVPAAGNLQIRLSDLAFPALSGALSFALVDGGAVLGVLPGAGSLDLDIAGPAELFAFVYAVGTPGIGIGSYYLNIRHEYPGPIPLPASVWLLLSGAAWGGWLGRRRRACAVRVANRA